jgi:hypothetical protein
VSISLESKLDSYGVYCLVALELRNWMTKEMGADAAVFELLGGTSIAEIGGIITKKKIPCDQMNSKSTRSTRLWI